MYDLLFALLAVLGGLILLVILLWLFLPARDVPVPYEARPLLSEPERVFYRVLREAAGPGVAIQCKVRLADLVRVRPGEGGSEWAAAFNRIARKHVDFVLCAPEVLDVLGVVELDDPSHERPDRRERDRFVDRALAEAGIPVFHVRAAASYDPDELERLLFEDAR